MRFLGLQLSSYPFRLNPNDMYNSMEWNCWIDFKGLMNILPYLKTVWPKKYNRLLMTASFIYEKNQNLKIPLLLCVVFDITEVPLVSDNCPFLKISTWIFSSAFTAVSNSLILTSNWAIRVPWFFTVLCNSVTVCISDSDGRFSNIEMR